MNRHVSATYLIPQAHWDAMADILGECETSRLYGARPELVNTATSVERLYFADKAPRRALWVTVGLACVLAVWVPYKAIHRTPRPGVTIDDCAMVLTRESGPECR